MSPNPFHVGDWRVEPALNQIGRGGRAIRLEPRVMQTLLCLARCPGEVVTREALLAEVWPDAVVVEKSVTTAVGDLRRALGDDPQSPRYIETIRKGGYRLIAPVTGAAPRSSRPAHRLWAFVWIASGIAVLGAVWLRMHSTPGGPTPLLTGFPLTSYPGCEQEPALSPDGHRVAFSWCGGDGQHYDIYVTQANSETPLRITDDPGYESHPAWSPDGNTIAFARSGPERGIYAVPSIGGPARRLCPTTGPVVGLDWSPDGRSIAFSSSPEPGAFLQILLLSRETLEVKPLVRPSPEFTCAFHPVFSPDGRSIAFVRSDLSGSQDVHVASRNGETSRRLTFTQRRITGLDWSADSRSILFVAAPGARYDLWRISASGGPVTWMPTAGRQVTSLTIADRDNRMVYEELHYDRDIWVQTTGAPGAVCLIGSTRQDWAPRFAPGGQRLAFLSTRSGEREIWVSRADGTDPRQLTHVNGRDVTPPCWSPDGEHLAFATTGGGTFNAHTIDLDTGETRRVPGGDDHQIPFVWSIDGRTLYCNRSSARGWEIWALPLEGGAPQCIAGDARSLVPQVGPAHALYYLRADSLGIWRMAPDGSGQTRIVPGPKLTRWREELIMGDAAYFIRPEAAGDVLGRFDFTSQAETVLGPLPQGAHELAVPADRDRAVFSRYRGIASDLTLIPRFD